MKSDPVSETLTSRLRAASLGLAPAVLTLLFGQGMGIVFGLNEDAIKSRLKASAAAVRDTVYKSDDAAIKPVLDKSWVYMQRAHLHAGGMGTTALGLIILLRLLGTSRCVTTVLGSTGAAKESLKWLAMPSSGAFVLATVAVLVLLIVTCARRQQTSAANN